MSMKITVPWQLRLPALKSRSPGSGGLWTRRQYEEVRSVPSQSVLMQEDDLDHLGALHELIGNRKKRKRFWKWF